MLRRFRHRSTSPLQSPASQLRREPDLAKDRKLKEQDQTGWYSKLTNRLVHAQPARTHQVVQQTNASPQHNDDSVDGDNYSCYGDDDRVSDMPRGAWQTFAWLLMI